MRALRIGHEVTYKILDRGLIEKIGPTGIVSMVGKMSQKVSELQSGQIYHYSLSIIIGTIVMIVLQSA